MKIIVLDGGDSSSFIDDYTDRLREVGHVVNLFRLKDLDIRFCTGCWACWWKTPGKCVHKDDMELIYSEIPDADILVCRSPLVNGMVSAALKKTQDRMIPLIHPYLEIDQGECHHRKRYPKYPVMGIILQKTAGHDEEDIEIVGDMSRRLAINFKSRLSFCLTEDGGIKEAVNETCSA
ncbi:MAG: flavodoxin family protein [Spirochaetia bacterium]